MSAGPASRIDQISDAFVEAYAALDPCAASMAGISGHDDELTDFGPAGLAARAQLSRSTLADLRAEVAVTAVLSDHDRVAAGQLEERLAAEVRLYEAGALDSSLNSIASPVQTVRMVFDLMPTEGTDALTALARRMRAVPAALAAYRSSLAAAASNGNVAARRQVMICAEQARTWAGRDDHPGFFGGMAARSDVDGPLQAELLAAAVAADAAYGELATFLVDELAPVAPAKDAVGRERYQLWSRAFTGAQLDLDETYAWGWEELARLLAEQAEVVERIVPGGTVADAVALLDSDPARQVEVGDLEAWLQGTSDEAVEALAGVYFDIPDPIRTLECKIAPPGGSSGAYYTGPSEDFSRPGQMWWSPAEGETTFSTWREKTTVYHEGVPGHHLQVAQTAYRASTLNRFQRFLAGSSGHQEGWALYAERLMAELGYLDDQGDRLGMLEALIFRAVRVVVDIGMHLELSIPAGTGFHEGERWTPELGFELMRRHASAPDAFLVDERDRYLGWPGQAPSYKVGERIWRQGRADAEVRHGENFDLMGFHRAALDLGVPGLDQLRDELALL